MGETNAGGGRLDPERRRPVKLTPSEWHLILEGRSFLERPENRSHPRRLDGAPVQIVPDDSYR